MVYKKLDEFSESINNLKEVRAEVLVESEKEQNSAEVNFLNDFQHGTDAIIKGMEKIVKASEDYEMARNARSTESLIQPEEEQEQGCFGKMFANLKRTLHSFIGTIQAALNKIKSTLKRSFEKMVEIAKRVLSFIGLLSSSDNHGHNE